MDHYDRLLVGMFASLLLGAVLGLYLAIDVRYGLLAGALLSTGFLWDAIVRRPPVPTAEPRYTAAIVLWHGAVLAALVAGV
ncbi:hypothetical protein C488_11969 [Natrinema pellirubrum DSM 15624]|uniref:Uncharacterized protein n=1 Tax=Natrinema pellirubrum (strain DSM 15624 / CIP 106293 / JCM 10476 / NCIMB 786 / 157) TaxID=797303 RepID=L0JM98_NATP1|nr:hypothetical protein [Natrinema pellirubrum]AGB32379.1 hypothetical protein Natpe_2570 [Natrinema pellirubrum DSM 15624]ELY73961.1 hypothetical protein C488_11969 [Natrinema pellirubrum DSM 15624]